jgi:hypothetical protein
MPCGTGAVKKGLGLGETAGQDVGEFAYFNRIVGEDAGDTFGRKDLLDVSRAMERPNPSGCGREWLRSPDRCWRCNDAARRLQPIGRLRP